MQSSTNFATCRGVQRYRSVMNFSEFVEVEYATKRNDGDVTVSL